MASKLTLQSTITLPNTTLKQPRLGFGVYTSEGDTCIKSCSTALRAGYRHIDSAQYYANELQVGKAVLESGIPRDEIYLTTKMFTPEATDDETYAKIMDSVKKISGGKEDGYVDLFLIHNAGSIGDEKLKRLWTVLERAHKEGKCRAIGVSNAGRGHIERMKKYAKVWPPHVNQIELHPWHQQRTAVSYCESQSIVVQAYCPLVRNQKASDPTLTSIAEKYHKSTGQVLIRYCLQKGWVPLPKSDTPSRIEANADVYDFEISDGDMERLDGLDEAGKGAIVLAVSND